MNSNVFRLKVHILFIRATLFLSVYGCSEFPNAGNSGSFTGIYCMLNPSSRHQDVYVVRAVNVEPFDDFLPDTLQLKVRDAEVMIRSDSQTVYLTEIDEGHYRDTAGTLNIQAGKKYRIDVNTPYGDHVSAETTVPNPPRLLLPNPIDTFTINIHIDTMYFPSWDTGSYLSVNNWPAMAPVYFLWSKNETMKSFYFELGADSALLNDQNGDNEKVYRYRIINTRSIIRQSDLTVFSKQDFYEDALWQWQGPYHETENRRIYADLFINIRAYSLTYNANNKYITNIQNGFGYFAATQITRKPVHVIMNWTIVR